MFVDRSRTPEEADAELGAVRVLWNPSAGDADPEEPLYAELVRHPGYVILEPGSAEEARDLAREAAEDGARMVVAAGGDGTINRILQGLLEHPDPPALAVLPIGTANDFARTLGLPRDPLEALRVLEEPQLRTIDLVRMEKGDGRLVFANIAVAGNGARISRLLDEDVKKRWGPFCYLRGTVEPLRELQHYAIEVRFDGAPPERFRALNVVVGNGRYSAGGLAVAPRASLEDGRMDVIILLDSDPIDLAGLAARFAFADYTESEHVVHRRAQELTLASQPPLPFTLDGNAVSSGPARFEVLPGALRVAVGPDYEPTPA